MHCAFSWTTTPAASMPLHTGGDIACAVETPDVVRVLIGDVMGHDAEAAVTAAEVAHAFQALAAQPDSSQVIATRLDEFIVERNCGEEFVTAQIVSVPKARDEPEIVCCGHPPPLLLRDGRAVVLDEILTAPPLGLLDLSAAQACSCPLGVRPGDGVLLYTDGVTDARDEDGHAFALAEHAATLGSGGVGDLRTDLLRHAGRRLRDDATLLHLQFASEQHARERRSQNNGAPIWFSAHYRSADMGKQSRQEHR